ncbi:MAG: porin family protein [Deferrisomatales bacterium]
MRHRLLTLLTPLLLLPSAALALEVGARAAYWFADLSGEVRLDDGIPGTTVDLTDDLGVDDENFFLGEAWLQAGSHRLSLGGFKADYSGTRSVSVVFGGKTFTGVTETSLEYVSLDLAYQYDLVDLENILAGFSLGPVVQVKYLDGEVKLAAAGQQESQSFQLPIPLVGLGLHVGLVADLLELRARGVGVAYSGNSIVELQGELSVNPMPFFEVVAGYRYFAIDVDEEDLLLDYSQTGPYAGLALKF